MAMEFVAGYIRGDMRYLPQNIHIRMHKFQMKKMYVEWLDPELRTQFKLLHDDVIKWKHLNSPHKGQWPGALIFSLICARINGWVNNRKAGDLRRYRDDYDAIVINTLWPKPNDHYFSDAIFKYISWIQIHEFPLRCHWILSGESN